MSSLSLDCRYLFDEKLKNTKIQYGKNIQNRTSNEWNEDLVPSTISTRNETPNYKFLQLKIPPSETISQNLSGSAKVSCIIRYSEDPECSLRMIPGQVDAKLIGEQCLDREVPSKFLGLKRIRWKKLELPFAGTGTRVFDKRSLSLSLSPFCLSGFAHLWVFPGWNSRSCFFFLFFFLSRVGTPRDEHSGQLWLETRRSSFACVSRTAARD